jgi:hypothetical protein
MTPHSKKTYEQAQEITDRKDLTILTDKLDFKGVSYPVKLMCKKGHIFTKEICRLANIYVCRQCYVESLVDFHPKRLLFTKVKKEIELSGFSVISTDKEYKNNNSSIKFICNIHGEQIRKTCKILDSIRVENTTPCAKCNIKKVSVDQKLPLENMYKQIINTGFSFVALPDGYKNAKSIVTLKCKEGHEFSVRWNNFQTTHRCTKCQTHKHEEECRQIMQSLFGVEFVNIRPDFLQNPDTGSNLELDCYNHDLNIALEYNGQQHYHAIDYWGGKTTFQGIQDRDILKQQLCDKNETKLIVVPYVVKNKERFILEQIELLQISHLIKEDQI